MGIDIKFKEREKETNKEYLHYRLGDNIIKCKNCLLPQGIEIEKEIFLADNGFRGHKIKISKNGKCDLCNKKTKDHKKKEQEYIKNINKKVLLMFSGGKDSVGCFFRLLKLGVNFEGFLFDNGYIPKEIIKNTKQMFQKHNIKLHIKHKKIDSKQNNLCQICSQTMFTHAKELIKGEKIDTLIYGNNFPVKNNSGIGTINNIQYINLPYIFNHKYKDIDKIFKKEKITTKKYRGYTSNCLIPGLEKERKSNNYNFFNDLIYIALEYRNGFYTKKEMINKILENHKKYKKYFN